MPGLPAKPTIDIQVSVASMVPRSAYVDPLEELGFVWTLDPWDDTHEFFSRDQQGERAIHLHVCRSGSQWERRHLAFRDWLRGHPEDAAAYATLKRHLAATHPRDVHTYTYEKGAFIREIEARAVGGRSRKKGLAFLARSPDNARLRACRVPDGSRCAGAERERSTDVTTIRRTTFGPHRDPAVPS